MDGTLVIYLVFICACVIGFFYSLNYQKEKNNPYRNRERIEHKCSKCGGDFMYKMDTITDNLYQLECPNCKHNEGYAIGELPEPIDYTCDKCSNTKAYRGEKDGLIYCRCTNCFAFNIIKLPERDRTVIPVDETHEVRCPYCNSNNVKKISTTSKVVSTAAIGLATMGKVNSQWHCNNCKSDF